MDSIQFVFPKRDSATGSVNMRVRQVYKELSTGGVSGLPLNGILCENRVRPWSRGQQFVWVKPKAWSYMSVVARNNRILIDLLDSHVWNLPRWICRAENVEFIVCTNKQKDLILKFYPKSAVHLIPHHFDPRLGFLNTANFNQKSGVGYIGSRRKFVETPEFNIEFKEWNDFVVNPVGYRFHWAVRPPNRMFHPETKVATAAVCGALPIVNAGELGTLLPLSYPFSIVDVGNSDECRQLRLKMEDDNIVSAWQERLLEIVKQTSLAASCEIYRNVLGTGFCRKT